MATYTYSSTDQGYMGGPDWGGQIQDLHGQTQRHIPGLRCFHYYNYSKSLRDVTVSMLLHRMQALGRPPC